MRTIRTLFLIVLSVGLLHAKLFKKDELKNPLFSLDGKEVVTQENKNYFLYKKTSAASYTRVKEITADDYANPQSLFGEDTTVADASMDPGQKKPIKAMPLQVHPPGCTCGNKSAHSFF